MAYQPKLHSFARHQLDQLPLSVVDTILDCLNEIAQDPYRDPHLRVHLYGKELRPGRKVGHVNTYGDDLEDCLERARHAAAWFRGDLGMESE